LPVIEVENLRLWIDVSRQACCRFGEKNEPLGIVPVIPGITIEPVPIKKFRITDYPEDGTLAGAGCVDISPVTLVAQGDIEFSDR
jgi:hypothetical protein